MSLCKIAWRSIQQRALASTLTGLSMALGVALVAAVLVIHGVVDRSFRRGAQGYDLIVGPKGSPLQLVLNTVYHMSEPVGKIPYRQFERVAYTPFPLPGGDVTKLPLRAIPVCMGGNYQGFRVVGTRPEFFELEHHEGEYYEFATSGGQGRNMEIDGYWEAVIGPTVARTAALKVGDTFQPRHGLDPEQGEEHRPFTVVGIFAPTGTPNDRAVFINIEGFWLMHEHPDHEEDEEEGDEGGDGREAAAAHGAGHGQAKGKDLQTSKVSKTSEVSPAKEKSGSHSSADPKEEPSRKQQPSEKTDPPEGSPQAEDDHAHATAEDDHDHAAHRQVSAILLVLDDSDPGLVLAMPRLIADIPGLQAVQPAREISKLLDGIVGNVQWVLLVLALLVVVVAGIGILVSIYNSMNDRRHEIAVMRALGASRLTVMLVILMESILLSLGGGVAGLLLAHGLIGLLGPLIVEQTGVAVGMLQLQAAELWLIPSLIVLASVVGYLPAVVAYKTDVAKSLAANV